MQKTINLVMAWWRSACTSPLEKVVLETTSRSLPEKLSNVQSGNLKSWKNLWMLEWELLLVEIMKLDWAGTMYEVLGPEGPYQSICSGRIDCAIDLTERSSTTLGSVYNWTQNLKELNSSQKMPWDLQMENTQLWKEMQCLDCYWIWQLNRQVLFELLTWVEKWIILDFEDMETIGQGWMSYSSCAYRDIWMQTSFSQPLIS